MKMSCPFVKALFSTLLLLAFTVLQVPAQTTRGVITGQVTDQNGIAISFAPVMLDAGNIGTITNEQGIYLLKAPAGKHTLFCHYTGYDTVTAGATIPENGTTTLDFHLSASSKSLDTVVVTSIKMKSATATRTLTEIQDIPQSIVVLGRKTIKQQSAFDLSTIVRNMSGINFTGNYSGAGSYQFFNARGFDMSNAQNYRWNGMMIWNLGNNYSDNIEQVEFLKGPTSILFGDVAPGGVLNMVTKKPLPDFYLNAELKTGEWNLFRPAVDISGPLTKDKTLRYRLNTSYEYSGSFRDHVESRRYSVAPTLVWDITPRLSVTTETVFRASSATDDAGLVSPDGTVAGLHKLSPSLYLGEPGMKYLFNDQTYFLHLTYQISKQWRFKAVGFYGYTRNRPFGLWFDPPDSVGNFARYRYGYHQWLENRSVSADIFGVFYTGTVKHNLLAGLEYQDTHYRYTNEGYLHYFDDNNIFHMQYGLKPYREPADKHYLPFISLISRSGFYFQDQVMMLHEKLHLLAGFRYGRTGQGNDYYERLLPGSDYEGYMDNIVHKNAFTPRVGLVFKPKNSVSLYASYAQGYEINSADIFAQNYAQYVSPPATRSHQVELGAKAGFFQHRLGATISLFQIDKKNPYGYVYLDPDNPNYDEYNVYYAGHHRSQGIELDADGKLNKVFSLTLGAAYTHTEVLEDPGYPKGNLLPNAPKYTGNFWLNYDPQGKLKGFSAGWGIFYKSKFFSGIDNNPHFEIPGSYTMDISAGYAYRQVSVQLNLSNLTNRVNYSNPWVYNLFEVRPLRRAIVTMAYSFKKTGH